MEVHIFGAIDTMKKYWIICKIEILKLPKNIKVKSIEDPLILKNYIMNILILIFFLCQNLSENFGYSIFEALSFGLPVIILKKQSLE